MEDTATRPARRIGRPLSFDRDRVLEKAMRAFWRSGYESTSIADLTSAMGINSPSLYTAFGDKRALFREAVQRYLTGGGVSPEIFIDGAATARDAAWGLLQGSAIAFTGEDTPPGCLLATSTISCSADAADLQHEAALIRRGIEDRLRKKIADATAEGEVPPETDATSLAGFIMSVVQGMSTLARDGAPREHLLRVAATAMRAWPS